MENKDKEKSNSKNKKISISSEFENISGNNLFINPEEMDNGIYRGMKMNKNK